MNSISVHNERVKYAANFLLALSVAVVGIGVAEISVRGVSGGSFTMICAGLAFSVSGGYILGYLIEE